MVIVLSTLLRFTASDSFFVIFKLFLSKNILYAPGRDGRYQRDNQNPNIKEEQKTQWTKEKVQKDKQRSTRHTYKTKDRVTRTPLKIGVIQKGKQFLLH